MVAIPILNVTNLVGLHHDVSDWVKAGFIKHEDMLNRNWSVQVSWALVSK